MADVQWGPAVGFLVGGLGIGALILWRLAPRTPQQHDSAAGAETLARRDLRAKFEALIAQLRELEDAAGRRTLAQLASERSELELAAAETLLALDQLVAAPAAESPEITPSETEAVAAPLAPAAVTKGSSLTGFFWGIGSAAALGLLFYFVSQSAEQRAPSGSVTGNTPMAARPAPQSVLNSEASGATESGAALPTDAELAALTARLAQNPDDLESRLELARLHLLREDLMAVFNETQEILKRDANSPRALSYQSLVRLAMGQADRAEEMLVRALQGDPGLLDGYVHLMLVYTSTGRMPEADTILERATQRFPERAASLRELLGEMKATAASKPGAAAMGEDPHAGVAVPGAAPTAAPPAPAPADPVAASARSSDSIAGIIELDPSAGAAFAPGAVVFVSLRIPGVAVGPPLAARRFAAASFPLAFDIGQADSMTGAQIPDAVLLEIRLDTDGDLATRPRSDPYGRAENVRLGTRNLRVTLTPRAEE